MPSEPCALHYSPGACSLVVHMVLEELGVPFTLKRVDLQAGEHLGAAFRAVNPKGKVPVLETPEGVITESVAIVEHLLDRHGDATLLAKPGTWARARTLERVATLATEVHPLFNRFFHPDAFSDDEAVRAAVKAGGTQRMLAWFREEDAKLTGPYWSGETCTVADHFFLVIARWGRWLTPPATRMANIEPFLQRMSQRPAVQRALAREGITAFS